MRANQRWIGSLLLAVGMVSTTVGQDVDYIRQVKPILATKCFACHGALKQEAGLRLDASALIRKGGDSGLVVQPGTPAQSTLIERLSSKDADVRMPPAGEGEPLTAEQIAIVSAWIEQGAKAPDEDIPADPRTHWAYQPPGKPDVPDVEPLPWMRNEIDVLVAAVHAKHGLSAATAAQRNVLLRRVYLDLIGVPPTRDQLAEFAGDTSATALERVVDRLLEQPEHGQRWGRHWMDIWRYSDWAGFGNELRYSQKHIWRWRDWIIDAVNADKGYDQMIVEMLAGDELSPADPDVLRATGFLARNWYKFDRNVWMDDTVEHTAKAFLGITLNCCRCHDHKYDPISQREYYGFRAIFEPYNVRTDRVPGQMDVATDGLVRVHDAKPGEVTYLFERGDPKKPVRDQPIAPTVPEVAGGAGLEANAIELPLLAYYPDLRDAMVQAQIDRQTSELKAAETELASAQAELQKAQETLAKAKQQAAQDKVAAKKKDDTSELDALLDNPPERRPALSLDDDEAFLVDDFDKAQPETWKVLRGDWVFQTGRVTQQQAAAQFLPMVTLRNHPQDFSAELKFRTTGGTTYRSVGLSFDESDDKEFQAVYVSSKNVNASVNVFHRAAGKDVYSSATAGTGTALGDDVTLRVVVRGRLMNVFVNGQFKLAHDLPVSRRRGRFAIWTFDATAEFDRLEIRRLPDEAILKPVGTPSKVLAQNAAPAATPESAVEIAEHKVAVAQKRITARKSRLAEYKARVAAERAKYGLDKTSDTEIAQLAATAGVAQQTAALATADESLAAAELALKQARSQPDQAAAATKKTVDAAQKKRDAAVKALEAAEKAVQQPSSSYSALGTLHGETSTGRRLALARWIADRRNPLTARVAVNHVWARHFGRPLVDRVDDFGLRSPQPEHAALLDYLAVFLMDNDWKLKPLHRLLVTSGVYALSSSARDADPQNVTVDPDNHLFWRAASRRMEAEVVRDSILALSGSLDRSTGGPEIPRQQGETSMRRSVYFQHARQRQVQFLEMFGAANPRECYRRKHSIRPQQAFTLMNSSLAIAESRLLARKINADTNDDFIRTAFETVLSRGPNADELDVSRKFLDDQSVLLGDPSGLKQLGTAANRVPAADDPRTRARENLVLVLFNHNDFLTIR